MRMIKRLSKMIEEEISDAGNYIECALKWKEEDPLFSKTFYDLSVDELKHSSMLHEEVVKMINKHKAEGKEVPEAMQNIYNYLHEKHTEDFNEIKLYQMQYKGQ